RGAANGYRYYLGNHPTGFGLEDIARATAACRDALACRNTMIHDLGLLHHEGRTWTGWHRHVVLVFLALGFLLENRTHIHSVV
ncbi:MAG TPA: IS701 family transposase, partial [Deltaproteobacteria bacterium]|nr:IS701 family transposase [Deltaproteobacteria bacterium]